MKAWTKNDSCYEDVSAKGTHLTTKMKAHAKVDKLPLLSFTQSICPKNYKTKEIP